MRGQAKPVRTLRHEGGSAMLIGLVLVAAMTLIGGTIFHLGLLESRLVQGDETSAQAVYCAEAGGARALAAIIPASGALLGWAGVPQSLATPLGNCAYVATYANTASPKRLTVTGTIGSVSRTLSWTGRSFSYGIVSGGGFSIFSISGNPTIQGSCGSLHTNGNLTISGSPSFSGSVTASGTYTQSGNPNISEGGESGGGRPLQPVPPIVPATVLATAKATLPANQVFQLLANGQVQDGNGASIATPIGWIYSAGPPAQWTFSGNTSVNGTYYVQGNANVSGNAGSPTSPWLVTIIATGNIQLSGNPKISAHLPGTLLVAGQDIMITGNPQQAFTGIIAAHEQIQITGNATIVGNIVAEDAASTSSLVTQSSISGNPTITYNCELATPVESWMVVWVWQECPTGSCG